MERSSYDLLTLCYRLTERANQTIVTHLMKVVNEKADDWDNHLPSVLFGYRINKQGFTRFSPFELLYGVKARLPLDLKGDLECGDEQAEDGRAQRIIDFGQHLVEMRNQAMENISAARQVKRNGTI